MEMRQKQAYEAYQRVQDFVNRHPVDGPAGYAGAKRLLDEVVTGLSRHTTNQASGGREGRAETVRQKVLTHRLRNLHLRPVAKIARAVLREAPGIHVALRIPPRQLPVMRLIAEATAVRKSVTPYEAVFVDIGRPADFLAQLDTAIETLRGSLVGRARNVGTRAGARLGITQEVRRGRDAVEMLDAIITTRFANDLQVLAEWRSARRVQAIPGSPSAPLAPVDGAEGDAAPELKAI